MGSGWGVGFDLEREKSIRICGVGDKGRGTIAGRRRRRGGGGGEERRRPPKATPAPASLRTAARGRHAVAALHRR